MRNQIQRPSKAGVVVTGFAFSSSLFGCATWNRQDTYARSANSYPVERAAHTVERRLVGCSVDLPPTAATQLAGDEHEPTCERDAYAVTDFGGRR